MRHKFLLLLLCTAVFSLPALADDWSKSYQVGDKAALRVETNDASIEITRGASKTIAARVSSEGYSIGDSGVRVTEHQDGDKVDLQVHVPNQWGFVLSLHNKAVHVTVQVPADTALDLRSGDGHIGLDGVSGQARLYTGDGHITVKNFTGGLNAHTGDGHMTIDGVLSDLQLRTGDGHIDVTVRPGSKMNGGWVIHTSDGRVEARLPQDFAAELYAHTGDGRIQLELPVEFKGDLERTRVRGKLNGGGPLMEISTGDGGIRIAKL